METTAISASSFPQTIWRNVRINRHIYPHPSNRLWHTVWCALSRPHPEDVFLDAMCGAGTILLERALIKRYRYLIGGDVSTDALDATVSNFGRQHQPRQFFHWDAQSLPLRSNTVDKIVCNLPFGETVGDVPELTSLYRQCLREYERVLRPRGRMVLLTSQHRLLNDELKQRRSLRVAQQLTVDVRGTRAWMCVVCPKTR